MSVEKRRKQIEEAIAIVTCDGSSVPSSEVMVLMKEYIKGKVSNKELEEKIWTYIEEELNR